MQKKSNFDIFESALYMQSVSRPMPVMMAMIDDIGDVDVRSNIIVSRRYYTSYTSYPPMHVLCSIPKLSTSFKNDI